MTKPYQGTTRPIVAPDSRHGRRGGYQGNDHELSAVQRLARKIDALYLYHIQRLDFMPSFQDVERLIIEAAQAATRAAEEAEEAAQATREAEGVV